MHADPKVINKLLDIFKEKFGALTITRGKTHKFLGMTLSIDDGKHSVVDMKEQIEEAVDMFKNALTGTVKTPATKYLLWVDDNKPLLNAERNARFHSVVAKCLYITKRAQPDIEPAVAFLCTRVSKSNKDDWNKLERLMTFLKNTINNKKGTLVYNTSRTSIRENSYQWNHVFQDQHNTLPVQ